MRRRRKLATTAKLSASELEKEERKATRQALKQIQVNLIINSDDYYCLN